VPDVTHACRNCASLRGPLIPWRQRDTSQFGLQPAEGDHTRRIGDADSSHFSAAPQRFLSKSLPRNCESWLSRVQSYSRTLPSRSHCFTEKVRYFSSMVARRLMSRSGFAHHSAASAKNRSNPEGAILMNTRIVWSVLFLKAWTEPRGA
jgi:hypothetical protein